MASLYAMLENRGERLQGVVVVVMVVVRAREDEIERARTGVKKINLVVSPGTQWEDGFTVLLL